MSVLDQTQKALDLMMAIDAIRDRLPEPVAMLAAITNLVTDAFDADLCMLYLLNRDTGAPELKAVNERSEALAQTNREITLALTQHVMQNDAVTLWNDETEAGDGLHLAGVPIILGKDKRLGALLVARLGRPFEPHETALFQTLEDQIDSAVIQGYAYHDLQQRNKELETIYRIDAIRDQNLPFDEMLHKVLHELRTTIEAEMGFVMLYDRAGRRLELRAATHDDILAYHEQITQAGNKALEAGELVCWDGLCALMCLPLILQGEIIGVLGVANVQSGTDFNAADQRLLSAIGSQMDTAIFESLERRRLREVLGRSVDPRVMERLLAEPDVDFLKGERLVLSVLYSDLRSSTRLAERTEPELLVGFINEYLSQMTDIILSHEGTLDKFVGDEVMALFGAPFPQEDYALRAVYAATDMQAAHQDVMRRWRQQGVQTTPIGIGIATGEMIAGEMGCLRRADYTVIGRAANLGARLCQEAKGDQVLICRETYKLVQKHVEALPLPGLRLKGVERLVTAYNVKTVKY